MKLFTVQNRTKMARERRNKRTKSVFALAGWLFFEPDEVYFLTSEYSELAVKSIQYSMIVNFCAI